MNKGDLLKRQQAILLRSTRLRERLSAESAVLAKPLWLMDQGKRGLQWLSRHPVWPASALVLVTVLKPRRTLVWGVRLWRALKAFQSLKAWMAPLQKK